jgi:transcriptional regulator with XRE-family HTH domain
MTSEVNDSASERAYLDLMQQFGRGISPAGELIKAWRERRRLSQLELSNRAEVSTRHLCFVETGRSEPSRRMILRIATALDVPLREQNELLLSAGFAPLHPVRSIAAPELRSVREALDRLMHGHEPYPAFVIDRGYDVIAANRSVQIFLEGVSPVLLQPPLNVVRVSLHPDGLASRLVNYSVFRENLLRRLHRDVSATGNECAAALIREVGEYSEPTDSAADDEADLGIATSISLQTSRGQLSFLTTLSTFMNPGDATLAELAIESFFPADRATADALRAPIGNDAAIYAMGQIRSV